MDLEEKLYREGFSPASFSKRVYAYTIDELFLSLIVFFAFLDKFQNTQTYIEIVQLLNSITILMIFLKIIYHTFFIYFYGKTLGKIVARIRTIDIYSFDTPSLSSAMLRAVVRVFSEMLLYLGFLFALTNPFIQTIHDKISKVVVIDD